MVIDFTDFGYFDKKYYENKQNGTREAKSIFL